MEAGITIGICDDENIYVEVLSSMIDEIAQEYEYVKISSVIKANSGSEFIKKCYGKKIDVIFIDLNLGKEDGYDISVKIKEMNPEVLIVFISGNNLLICNCCSYRPYSIMTKDIINIRGPQVIRSIFKIFDRDYIKIVGDRETPYIIDRNAVYAIEANKHSTIIYYKNSNEMIRCAFGNVVVQIDSVN